MGKDNLSPTTNKVRLRATHSSGVHKLGRRSLARIYRARTWYITCYDLGFLGFIVNSNLRYSHLETLVKSPSLISQVASPVPNHLKLIQFGQMPKIIQIRLCSPSKHTILSIFYVFVIIVKCKSFGFQIINRFGRVDISMKINLITIGLLIQA